MANDFIHRTVVENQTDKNSAQCSGSEASSCGKYPRANGFWETTVVKGRGISVAFYTCAVDYSVDGICGYARFDGCRSDIQNFPGQLERRRNGRGRVSKLLRGRVMADWISKRKSRTKESADNLCHSASKNCETYPANSTHLLLFRSAQYSRRLSSFPDLRVWCPRS